MKKRFYLVFLLAFIIGISVVSALGVSPGLKKYNFQPGFETEIEYRVFANTGQELEIYVIGDLKDYVELSKKSLIGSGKFIARIKLPESIEKPGKHRIAIGVREVKDEELVAGGAIGTSVTIYTSIDIYVPYPGKYLEISLEGHDANVGEPINFILDIISKGKEDVMVIPRIEIYSQEKKIGNLLYSPRTIKSQEEVSLKKTLDTSNYNPGKYSAAAIVDYGGLATDDFDFKIGELVIDVVDYSKQVFIGKLQPFNIQIESGWNDMIDGAYAEIYFFNETKFFEKFKTTSTSLVPWERKTITGYFDSSNFTQGVYNANITLIYYGKQIGKSSSEIVEIEFVKAKSMSMWYLIGGAGLLIIIVLIVLKFVLKNAKGTKSKNKKTSKKAK